MPIKTTRPRPASTKPAPRKPSGAINIKPRSGDPGITLSVDAANGKITLRGVAAGPLVKKDAFGVPDYSVARGVGFELDMKSMPSFAGEPDYRAKNRWYFAHTASIDTTRGWTAAECAKRLAEKVNEGGAYRAVVSVKGEAATIALTAK